MYKLVVIADDFTGALDTGVQFAKKGISTLVTANYERDFDDFDRDTQVLVLNIETRHLEPNKAYQVVKQVAEKCNKYHIQYIYKKTDSGLRGNVGSELTALVDVFEEENVTFVPAFPKTNRITSKGIHYINGKRVTETEFGRDPFEPVRYDHVQDIIADQSDVTTVSLDAKEVEKFNFTEGQGKIYILDAEAERDLSLIASSIKTAGNVRLLAGCAGFAEYLPQITNLYTEPVQEFNLKSNFLVVTGSVNEITLRQIEYAQKKGYRKITLTPEEKLSITLEPFPDLHRTLDEIKNIYLQTGKIIVDGAGSQDMIAATSDYAKQSGLTEEEIRETIAMNIGKVVKRLDASGIEGTYIIIGGDTLKSVLDNMGMDALEPIAEIDNGIVLSKVVGTTKNYYIVSKSGGFGKEDALLTIENFLKVNSRCEESNV